MDALGNSARSAEHAGNVIATSPIACRRMINTLSGGPGEFHLFTEMDSRDSVIESGPRALRAAALGLDCLIEMFGLFRLQSRGSYTPSGFALRGA